MALLRAAAALLCGLCGALLLPLLLPGLPAAIERVPQPFYWLGGDARDSAVLLLEYYAPPEPLLVAAGSAERTLPHAAVGACPSALPAALLADARARGRIERMGAGALAGLRWLRVELDDPVGVAAITSLYTCRGGTPHPLFAAGEVGGLPLPRFGLPTPLIGAAAGLLLGWALGRTRRA